MSAPSDKRLSYDHLVGVRQRAWQYRSEVYANLVWKHPLPPQTEIYAQRAVDALDELHKILNEMVENAKDGE